MRAGMHREPLDTFFIENQIASAARQLSGSQGGLRVVERAAPKNARREGV